jgi:hypothetical protein
MSPSLKHLSGETQRIAQEVLVNQALSAPRLAERVEKLERLLRLVEIGSRPPRLPDDALMVEIRALLEETKP